MNIIKAPICFIEKARVKNSVVPVLLLIHECTMTEFGLNGSLRCSYHTLRKQDASIIHYLGLPVVEGYLFRVYNRNPASMKELVSTLEMAAGMIAIDYLYDTMQDKVPFSVVPDKS